MYIWHVKTQPFFKMQRRKHWEEENLGCLPFIFAVLRTGVGGK